MVEVVYPPRPDEWSEDDELSQRAYYHLLAMWNRTGGDRDIIATKGGHIAIAVGTAGIDMSAEKDTNDNSVEQQYYFVEFTGTPGAGVDVVFTDLEATYILWNNTDQILTMKTDTDSTGVAWAIGEINIMATESVTYDVRKILTIDGTLEITSSGVLRRAAITGEVTISAASNVAAVNPGGQITPVSGDKVLIQDASDNDSLQYADFDDIGGGGGGTGVTGGNTLDVDMTAVGNVGTGEDDLITYAMPADTLDAAGKGVRITAWGTTANNGNAKTLKIYFGSVAIGTYSLTISQAGTWFVDAQVYSIGTDTQQTVCKLLEMAGDAHDLEQSTSAEDDGATITIKVTGEATANDDIIQEGSVVELMSSTSLSPGGAVTVATGDKVLIQDVSDSDSLQTVTAQSIADLSAGGYPPGFLYRDPSKHFVELAADRAHDVNFISTINLRDTANGENIDFTTSLIKQVDTTWAAGTNAGGLFSGTVAGSTAYYGHIIVKDSDSSLDAGFDTSATAANIPSGYTAYRKVVTLRTDASANWEEPAAVIITPPTAGWTRTVGTNVAGDSNWTDEFDYQVLQANTVSSDGIAVLERTMPSTPYALTVRLQSPGASFADLYCAVGIGYRDSSGGRLEFFNVGNNAGNGTIAVTDWASLEAATSNRIVTSGDNQPAYSSGVWMRLVDDGTNVSWFYGTDGVAWLSLGSFARAVYVTTPDRIFFGFRTLRSGGSAEDLILACQSWHES